MKETMLFKGYVEVRQCADCKKVYLPDLVPQVWQSKHFRPRYNLCPNQLRTSGMAIKALEEIQQYRAIGTVEECREARERQISHKVEVLGVCPKCSYDFGWELVNFCPKCGQKLDRG